MNKGGKWKVSKRKLGSLGLEVSSLGLGCMTMSGSYGRGNEKESIDTIHRALDLGINFLDTADIYGNGHNEELIRKALGNRRQEVILATKFGNVFQANGGYGEVNGRPEYIKKAVEDSLRRIGTDYIDLYYQHRVDPDTPIEETVGALADLVQEGKVRYIGLSEASAQTIRRAHVVHPITALQSEYSLWTRDVEDEILPTLRELGIGLVPFSPLGRGFLTGALIHIDQLEEKDNRRNQPRFQGGNFAKNQILVKQIEFFAQEKGITTAQLVLAWVLAQGNDIVPIPGTKRKSTLEENVGAIQIKLNDDEIAHLNEFFPPGIAAGARLPKEALLRVNI